MPKKIKEPELEILFEEGEISKEEQIEYSAMLVNFMLENWDFSAPEPLMGSNSNKP